MLFQGHPLGHNILGTREQVQQFTTSDAQRFTGRYYRPDNAIFFVYGDVDFTRLVKRLGTLPRLSFPDQHLPQGGGWEMAQKEPQKGASHSHHQAHVMLGCRTFGYDDPRRIPLFVLNNMLGGPGMNARLNLSLRERNGLVYTIESTSVNYSDTGYWSVYLGCDHHDVKRCLRLVRRELDRMMHHPLSDRQLTAVKRQLKGQLTIACDNREQFALDFAKHFLHYGQERYIGDFLQMVDAVTAAQIQQVAQEFFAPEQLQLLTL